MTEDTTRLNIERARAALARARMDEASAAVRAPRPADLSRLQEDQARAETLTVRADAFRTSIRDKLGLGEYSGPMSAAAQSSLDMDAPLCDAAVCAPSAPVLSTNAQANAASQINAEVMERPAIEETVIEDAQSAQSHAESDVRLDPPVRRRRKFLGLF